MYSVIQKKEHREGRKQLWLLKKKNPKWGDGILVVFSVTQRNPCMQKRIQFCCVLYLFRQIAGCNQQYTQSGDCCDSCCSTIKSTKIQKSQGLILLLSSLLFCAFLTRFFSSAVINIAPKFFIIIMEIYPREVR